MTANQTHETAARGAARVQAGFTLLEIMVVLAIIALIAGSVGVVVFNRYKKAQSDAARTRAGEIASATLHYMLDNNNNCPKGIEDLVSGKYLNKKATKDPWGKEFIFRCPSTGGNDGADVISAGPDKQEGTADDVKAGD